jgi:hypothetical protein
MGRKKLNRSGDEIREQWKLRRKRYYEKHRDRVCKEERERYRVKKNREGETESGVFEEEVSEA